MKQSIRFFLSVMIWVMGVTLLRAETAPALPKKCKNWGASLAPKLMKNIKTNDASAATREPLPWPNRVTFDGFIPTSANVGPSPSNQERANDDARYFQIMLPQGYDDPDNAGQYYPVIYFLHGYGLDHTCYGALLDLFSDVDNDTFILVKIDGSTNNGYLGSFFTNSSFNGNFQRYFVEEVLDYVETKYRAYPFSGARLLLGHGMGGYGALLTAFKNPDKFAAVYAFSPSPIVAIDALATDPDFYEGVRLEIQGSGEAAGKVLPTNGPNSFQLFAWAAALSPNEESPFSVDLPIVIDENFVPELTAGKLTPNQDVLDRWKKNDPYTIATENPEQIQGFGIVIVIGKDEPIIDVTGAKKLHARLDDLGISHDFGAEDGSLFAQPPSLIPYSPSNDIPLNRVFPTLVRVATYLFPESLLAINIAIDLVIRALQADSYAFNTAGVAQFKPYLSHCSIPVIPSTTIGNILSNPTFRTCLSNDDIDPNEFTDGFFEVTGLLNIDPTFFKIETDGFLNL